MNQLDFPYLEREGDVHRPLIDKGRLGVVRPRLTFLKPEMRIQATQEREAYG